MFHTMNTDEPMNDNQSKLGANFFTFLLKSYTLDPYVRNKCNEWNSLYGLYSLQIASNELNSGSSSLSVHSVILACRFIVRPGSK